MFFLGASAHILIYLLVPAFLIVCLYFNGKPNIPEVYDLSSVCIMHEPQAIVINRADTYIYCIAEQQEKEKVEYTFYLFTPPHISLGNEKNNYATELISQSLRAPPALILG